MFNIFPQLEKRLSYFKIGSFPTPIQRLDGLCSISDCKHLFIKRDDLCGTVYGGNKVRKLEFLIGDALSQGARHVITSGAAGSNHARATATYASLAKLQSTLMLFDQPPSPTVRENLLADYSFSAKLYGDETYDSHCRHLKKMVDEITVFEGKAPYIIPAGGSSPIGTVGFVNASFELNQQIESGQIEKPVAIFTAFGTMGTVAGLVLGTKLARLSTTIYAARVVPNYVANKEKCLELIEATNRLLHDADTTIPIFSVNEYDFEIIDSCFGNGYAIPTQQGNDYIELIRSTDNIELDSVYTGKCGAAFYEYIKENKPRKPVLFWNTKNSHADTSTHPVDYRLLPKEFHKYFTNE